MKRVIILTVGVLVIAAGVAGAGPGVGKDGGLPLPVAVVSAAPSVLRAGEGPEWARAGEIPIHMNRTPPIYEGDPTDDGYRPTAGVALIQSGDSLFVRLRWTDATDSDPRPPARYPDGGETHIYKEHSRDIERFADAACVMVPRSQGPTGSFPAVMMGDRDNPVDLYYWNRARGFEVLGGAGRGTVEGTGASFPGTMRRTGEGWEVVFELPVPAPGTPVAFAVWDGDRDQRSGLKFYSLWYEVTP